MIITIIIIIIFISIKHSRYRFARSFMDCKEVDIWTYCSIYLDEMKSDCLLRETEKNRQMISQILSTTFAPCSSHKVRSHHQRIESFEHCKRIYPWWALLFGLNGCVTLNRLWFVGSWFLNRVYNSTIYLVSGAECLFGPEAFKAVWRLVMSGLHVW